MSRPAQTKIGRPPKDPNDLLSESVEVKLTPKIYGQIMAQTDNESKWGREVFEKVLDGRLIEADSVPRLPNSAVVVGLEPDQYDVIKTLAEDRGLDIPGLFKLMARRATKISARALNQFLYDNFFEDGEIAADEKRAELTAKKLKPKNEAA